MADGEVGSILEELKVLVHDELQVRGPSRPCLASLAPPLRGLRVGLTRRPAFSTGRVVQVARAPLLDIFQPLEKVGPPAQGSQSPFGAWVWVPPASKQDATTRELLRLLTCRPSARILFKFAEGQRDAVKTTYLLSGWSKVRCVSLFLLPARGRPTPSFFFHTGLFSSPS